MILPPITVVGSDANNASFAASLAASLGVPEASVAVVPVADRGFGVGSKVNHSSIYVYEKAKNYKQFEFIWDPSKDAIVIGGAGQQIGTPAGQPGQSTPFGTSPNSNSNPNSPTQPQPGPPET